MATPLLFRPGTRTDTPALVALLNQTFRVPTDLPMWEWFTYGNPWGETRVYLAEDPDRRAIAGIFAFTPGPLRLAGEHVQMSHGHHLVLAPEHRGGPAFVAFSRYALQAEASLGVRFVIGLLNRNSYEPHKFLMKWTDFGFLECLRKLSPVPRGHSCREVLAFPREFDSFYGRVSRHLNLHCDKTREWMDWRFFQRPGKPYTVYVTGEEGQMEGYIVLKKWRDPDGYSKAHIIDIHALEGQAVAQLLAAAETYAGGSDELNLWAIQGYSYRSILEDAGFISQNGDAPQPLAVRTLDERAVAFPAGPTSFSYGDGDSLY